MEGLPCHEYSAQDLWRYRRVTITFIDPVLYCMIPKLENYLRELSLSSLDRKLCLSRDSNSRAESVAQTILPSQRTRETVGWLFSSLKWCSKFKLISSLLDCRFFPKYHNFIFQLKILELKKLLNDLAYWITDRKFSPRRIKLQRWEEIGLRSRLLFSWTTWSISHFTIVHAQVS